MPRAGSNIPDFELMRFTPYRAAVVAQLLSEALAKQYRKRFGISIPDWRVLVHLVESGGASVRDIERRVAMEKSKVSRAAARLEARGLIIKRVNASDRRLVHLSLTESGEKLMSELLPIAIAFQEEIEAKLGGDFKAYEDGMGKLLAEFQDLAF